MVDDCDAQPILGPGEDRRIVPLARAAAISSGISSNLNFVASESWRGAYSSLPPSETGRWSKK
jgi:hypothetical protein